MGSKYKRNLKNLHAQPNVIGTDSIQLGGYTATPGHQQKRLCLRLMH